MLRKHKINGQNRKDYPLSFSNRLNFYKVIRRIIIFNSYNTQIGHPVG